MTAQSSFSGVGRGAATLAEQIPPGVVSGRRPAGDAVATLFVVGLFWTGSLAIAGGGWGGALRTAGQLGVAALAGWATTSARAPRGTPVVGVLVCVLALLTADLGMALWDAMSSHALPTVDIGATTIRAVRLWWAGGNPYTTPIDSVAAEVSRASRGLGFFAGFKYGPVMIWAYAPGVLWAGAAGYFLTSALAQAAVAGFAALCARRHGGVEAALGTATLALLPASLPGELFVAGVNDAVPLALLMAAFLARAAGVSAAAGVLLGLSAGAKLLPAVLVALPLVLYLPGRRGRAAVLAIATAVACHASAVVAAPREVVANLLLFQMVRPPDATSLKHLLPAAWHLPVTLASWVAIAAVVVPPMFRDRVEEPGRAAARVCTVLVLFLWGASAVHGNYLLWLFPFLALAVGQNLWGRTAP